MQLRSELIKEYTTFLKKLLTGSLTQRQLQLLHAIKLAATPKDHCESRIIMTFGVHAKIAFSMLTSSKLKRDAQMRSFNRQCGAKRSGAEIMTRMLQQTITQKPSFDAFSADAVKAFYSLNRDFSYRQRRVDV